MIVTSVQKLTSIRKTSDELLYLKQVRACVGAIGRIPNGMLRGHVDRDELAKAVVLLITELDSRIAAIAVTGDKPGERHDGCML